MENTYPKLKAMQTKTIAQTPNQRKRNIKTT